jgi:sialic acid synthase SpsE
MNPTTWAEMVGATRQLERAMGSGDKFVAENEQETVIIQRRCLRAARQIEPGELISREMIDVLRPATAGAILPYEIQNLIGLKALEKISFGEELRWTQFGNP